MLCNKCVFWASRLDCQWVWFIGDISDNLSHTPRIDYHHYVSSEWHASTNYRTRCNSMSFFCRIVTHPDWHIRRNSSLCRSMQQPLTLGCAFVSNSENTSYKLKENYHLFLLVCCIDLWCITRQGALVDVDEKRHEQIMQDCCTPTTQTHAFRWIATIQPENTTDQPILFLHFD